MPKSLAIFLFVSTATFFNSVKVASNFGLSFNASQSNMPVSETPNNLSYSVLSFHTLRKYLNSVRVD